MGMLSSIVEKLSSWPPSVVFSGFLALILILRYVFQAASRIARNRTVANQYGCKPAPRFPQRPLLGLDTAWASIQAGRRNHLLETSRARFQQVGARTFSMKILGRPIVYTMDPETLKAMLATSFQDWGLDEALRKKAFIPFIGDGIFTSDDEHWKTSRDMLKPQFSRSRIEDIDMLAGHVTSLIAATRRELASEGSVDLGRLFFRLTTDSATELLLGESTCFLENPKARFPEAFDSVIGTAGHVSRVGSLAHLFIPKKVHKDREYLHNFVDRFVDNAIAKQQKVAEKATGKQDQERFVFVDELARQTSDRTRIRAELLNILFAGRDTTASLLTNLWWVLARRPEVYQRLQSEIDALKGSPLTAEALRSCKYLQACIKECLRLYPVVPLNSRAAKKTTVLPRGGGEAGDSPILVPAGNIVVWSLYAIHRDPEFYGPDADVFRPERWLDDLDSGVKGLRPGWHYLPFNGGPRICLGQQVALIEASYTTARLCQEFIAVETRDERPWTEQLTITCVNKHGAVVSLITRE